MENTRTAFERELRLKLNQKATAKIPEDAVLLRNFKYFDLNNNGRVDRKEFVKVITKIGVNSFDPQEIENIFSIYDLDGDGSLDYKEFASMFFSNDTGLTKKNSPSKAVKRNQNSSRVEDMIKKIKAKLANRGTNGLFGLARTFRNADENGNSKLEFSEFAKCMMDLRLGLSKEDIQELFIALDKNNDGVIVYDEFVEIVKGSLSVMRRGLIERAFKRLDRKNAGILDLNDIKAFYDATQHPDVLTGRRREAQVLTDFVSTLEEYLELKGIKNDIVTPDDFIEYYSFISSNIDDDKYFSDLLTGVWRLNTLQKFAPRDDVQYNVRDFRDSKSGKSYENKRGSETKEKEQISINKQIELLMQRFRSRLSLKGARGFLNIHKQFQNYDSDHDEIITKKEFLKVVKDFRVDITEQDSQYLFTVYDKLNAGVINFEDFMAGVVGEMNESRAEIVGQAWRKIDRDREGKVPMTAMKTYFVHCRNHPDAKSGKKTEDEILEEFIETLETHQQLRFASMEVVTKEDFFDYFSYLSAAIDDDKYFELILVNVFDMVLENKQTNQYAGKSQRGEFIDPKKGYLYDFHRGVLSGKGIAGSAPFGTYETTNTVNYSKPNFSSRTSGIQTPSGKGGSFGSRQQVDSVRIKEVLNGLRAKLKQRGAKGIIGLQRTFKIIDDDGSKSLSYDEFLKAMKDFRIDIKEDDVPKLFSYFDSNQDGSINYDEFLRAVIGEMSDFRKNIVKKIFTRLDVNGDGVITIDDIRDLYNARNHPDVKLNRKTEEEVQLEFLDTFENHHAVKTNDPKGRDKKVTLEEFIEYYNNISMSIDDDNYFELMMNNSWRNNNQKVGGWKGDYSNTRYRPQTSQRPF